ncbi:DUF2924 domain-containing protein [Rubinisphaera margarita]|uniref:DUF2924 domain-containing protein n=1 Tax=Rubinisphaera margarita TaxID=2909586 RepID=UPI001EE832F7|nr:DUF2924 domain-containing protein [Rubinisphaera margarita]MCG6158326.1 DUF2924 domain-containing protein [Rubinisphaera margarita]
MKVDVEFELARLRQLTTKQLKEKYEDVFREACRSNHRTWLIKRIIWRMQANAYGDISERARQRAFEIANDADLRVMAPKSTQPSRHAPTKVCTSKIETNHDPRVPLPGTTITREYKGQTLQVTVLADGFLYAGEVYKSLSAVAKAITGSHGNGFLFFRLNGKEAKNATT